MNPRLVIDGGANLGLATLYFKRCYPETRVIAVEADPAIVALLEKNVENFELNDVEIVEGALWKEPGTIHFQPDGADGGTIVGNPRGISVDGILLSELIGEKTVDFLKLDIEGAEVEVIQEAAAVLPQVNRLYIEYHSFPESPQELSRILSILESSGYRYYLEATSIEKLHPLSDPYPLGPFDNQLNIFAWRDFTEPPRSPS